MKRLRAATVLFAALAIGVGAPIASANALDDGRAASRAKTTQIQILGLNDFHGQLEVVPPTASSSGRIGALTSGQCVAPTCIPAGGVEYLATHVRALRAQNPNTVFVSAGDLIGATPLLSALFHDEPTIEAFNLMDLDYNGVGNHEFDEGIDELLRMQNGGCHPDDGCGDGDGFDGADFQFLAANVAYKDTGETIFPPYAIREFKGVKVAFVGMTLEGTPLIVSPGGIASVDFLDEAESVNALVPILQEEGIETIIVLLHEGGNIGAAGNGAGDVNAINSCNNPTGALPPIVDAMDDEIDVVITGHTNWAVHCVIDGKVVTGAAAQGRLITDIDLTISRATKDVVGPILVNNQIVTQDVAKAPDLTALIAEYNVFAGPIAAEVVGHITGPLTRAANPAGESTMGRLIADAQLESTLGVGAQIAFMNPGGMRADLAFVAPGPDPVTHGEAFGVQPFSNIVTTKTFTGAQIKTILEQQFVVSSGAQAGNARTLVLPVSAGFTYTWTASAVIGSKVSNMMLNGVPIDPALTYRVTANNFLAGGGDDFPGFTVGVSEDTGLDDLVALEQYLGAHDPYTPVAALNQITRLP